MEEIEIIISDKELSEAFENTKFGDSKPRDIVKFALLNAVCGYANGHTAQCIIQELGLVGKSHMKGSSLTKKGKLYFWECFNKK